MSREDRVYDGCECQELCNSNCQGYPNKEKCTAFYRFKKVQRKNKSGKLINKYSKVEV